MTTVTPPFLRHCCCICNCIDQDSTAVCGCCGDSPLTGSGGVPNMSCSALYVSLSSLAMSSHGTRTVCVAWVASSLKPAAPPRVVCVPTVVVTLTYGRAASTRSTLSTRDDDATDDATSGACTGGSAREAVAWEVDDDDVGTVGATGSKTATGAAI